MSQVDLPVYDIKDLLSVEEVGGLLKEGIVHVFNICTSLFGAHVDPTTDKCSNYKQIREHIEHAHQCLTKSEAVIKNELKYLDKCREQFIKEREHAEQKKKERSLDLDKLHEEKESYEELLQISEDDLEQAVKSVAAEKDALEIEKARRYTFQGVSAAGSILLVMPVLGWIAGGIMVSEGLRRYVEASNAIKAAEKEAEKAESKVKECRMKVCDYRSKIADKLNDIKETDEDLNKIQKGIEGLKQHLEDINEIQENVRKAVHFLTVLSGRANVLEVQTRHFILHGPVKKAMEDVMKVAANIVENQLLFSQNVSGLMKTLRENITNLMALCNSPDNSDYDSYY